MKSTTFLAVLALGFASSAAHAADAQAAPQTPPERSYYYWLHPKLGMVKVDRRTNAMITGRRASQPTDGSRAAPAPRP